MNMKRKTRKVRSGDHLWAPCADWVKIYVESRWATVTVSRWVACAWESARETRTY